MNSKAKSGCGIAALVFLIILLAASLLVVGLFRKASSHRHRLAKMQEQELADQRKALEEAIGNANPDAIVIRRDSGPEIPPFTGQEPLTEEQFVNFFTDGSMTDLARSEFRKRAEGTIVTWRLQAADIRDQNGSILGKFELPYQIVLGKQTTGSSVTVQAAFGESSRDELLPVRRGDWLDIAGRVTFSGNTLRLADARLLARP